MPRNLRRALAEPAFQPCFRLPPPRPQPDELEAAADLLATSERPLVLVGGGAAREPARTAVVALAEALEAPVAATWTRNAAFPNGHRLYVTASIGITFYPDDGEDAEALLRNADNAVYVAKAEGRNTYQMSTAEMTTFEFDGPP